MNFTQFPLRSSWDLNISRTAGSQTLLPSGAALVLSQTLTSKDIPGCLNLRKADLQTCLGALILAYSDVADPE